MEAVAATSTSTPVVAKKKGKIRTTASGEAMRWAGGTNSAIHRQPRINGNDFDVRMVDEPDGVAASKKIAGFIKRNGICLVLANAPEELLVAANEEAELLWQDSEFSQPFQVHDDRGMLEARCWRDSLQDEEKVVWIKTSGVVDDKKLTQANALKLLAKNMTDFAIGLGSQLALEVGVSFDRLGCPMLSCYTGDREYGLHIDNPHGNCDTVESGDAARQRGLPDNSMRLTLTYYLNTQWSLDEDSTDTSACCAGGLDVHLTDPASRPADAGAAKAAPRLRIAPHSDTLAIFLSDRMAHQVIATQGREHRWYCITLWCYWGDAMKVLPRKLAEMEQQRRATDEEGDSD
eukprot:TRINITY_DN44744_c0_g1_i1.p1 TRINITY_DN44744_c0_g1~~TRINITY_DN44744_c0_g1_i1.p1  ORF type:complete len:347 (+),score=55.64 TRINITY_DN44744_c0_g1_i1:132-1172(+)